MDPTQALITALRALFERDRETVIENLVSLAEWLDRGGFMPAVYPGLRSYEDQAADRKTHTFTIQEVKVL